VRKTTGDIAATTSMNPTPIRWRDELKGTLILAGPIVINQVGHMSMGMVDTLVAGRISTDALAGLGLAANFFWTFTNVCMGCLLALDTYFSQSVGARDERSLTRYLGQSGWSAIIMTLLSAAGVGLGTFLYISLADKSPIQQHFVDYIAIISWSLPSLFFYFVLQRYWQARHKVLWFTAIIVLANVLNLLACVGLGLGRWGLPRLEVRGLAWATVICRYLMLLLVLLYTWVQLRPKQLRWPRIDWSDQKRFFLLGLPAAGHTALEVGAFTIATFAAGTLGAVSLAAHHVTLMMAAFTFMFPLGFSAAAAVRVGSYVGAQQPQRARIAGWLCIGLSMAVMSHFALGYIFFPRTMLGWFSQDPAVIELGAKILILVALFEIADGIQVSATGALRGIGNTRTPMLANLVGHYPIGLTLGFILCFSAGFGVVGLWAGLATGLFSVATMLLWVWWKTTRDLSNFRPLATQSTVHHRPKGS
jgi:MATE family multidrug resistance protein